MKYYIVEKKNNIGEQYVGETVFASIAMNEISKIDNVDIAGHKNSIQVTINDLNQVIIDVQVVVSYGVSVNKVVNQVQNEIIQTITNQIGLKQIKVNVVVDSIKFS